MSILAATRWASNAELIADVHALGYLEDDDQVLDATYGRGTWWKQWKPEHLTTNDLDPSSSAFFRYDFRNLPWDDDYFDAVAFDPPYIAQGGRKTSTIGDFLDRYGLDECPQTAPLIQELINEGLAEMLRVVRPGGTVLVKCKDYVTSGSVWLGTHHTLSHALRLGFKVDDRLEHVGRAGPQPKGRPQIHARRNLSTLLILRKLKTPPRDVPA